VKSPSDGLAGISPVQSYADYTLDRAVGEVAGPLPVVGLVVTEHSQRLKMAVPELCCEALVALKNLTDA
jgi:hypothetical protein